MHNTSTDTKSITPTQVRAARALLGWSTADLAARAGIGTATVSRYENGATQIEGRSTLRQIVAALESNGIRFIDETTYPDIGIGVALVALRS